MAKLGLHKSELVKVCLSAIADILYRVPLYRSVPIYENSLSSSTPEDAVFNNYFPPPPLFPPPPPSWNGDTNAILREAIFISIDSQETVSVHSTRVCTGLLYYIGTLTQFCLLLVHGQMTIIFIVSDCLSVCAEFFSAVFDPISIKLGHMLYVWVWLCPLEYRGCATPGSWVTPKNLYF